MTMDLPSGIYTIENLKYRNWAMLLNADDNGDVIASSASSTNVGEKWYLERLHNGTYYLRNQLYEGNSASYFPVGVEPETIISVRDRTPMPWKIIPSDHAGSYLIFDDKGSRCWSLQSGGLETPVMLDVYKNSDCWRWIIIPDNVEIGTNPPAGDIPQRKSIPKIEYKPRGSSVTTFTGRGDYLAKLKAFFERQPGELSPRKIFLLYGMGGIGKTQTCLKFIEENSSLFSKIFWIDASSAETNTHSFQNIARCPEARAVNIDESMPSVVNWLSDLNSNWLLVFDNADGEPNAVSKSLPPGNQGNILITSRNHDMKRIASPRAWIEVDKMDETDAISLLLNAACIDDEYSEEFRETSKQIVKELCCVPLAVDQAGAAIASGLCNMDDYLSMYSRNRRNLLEDPSYKNASVYGRAIYETWDFSFRSLEEKAVQSEVKAQAAITILQTFAFFHCNGISEDIFRRAAEAPQNCNIHLSDLTQQLLRLHEDGKWNSLYLRQGIQILLSCSLIKRIGFGGAYSVHPLVHCWSRDRMSQSDRQANCGSAMALLSRSITYGTTNDFIFRSALLLHIKATERYAVEAGPVQIFGEDDTYVNIKDVLFENGYFNDGQKLIAGVVEKRKMTLGDEHPRTLQSMADLASAYNTRGQWNEAEKLILDVTETRKRVLGAEHHDTLTSMLDCAEIYEGQGRLKEAESLVAEVIEIRRRVLGTEHQRTLEGMARLAMTYDNQGRWEEAEMLFVDVMKIRKRVLGAEHPDTLNSMTDLASAYEDHGQWEDAVKLYVDVKNIQKKVLGTEHPETLETMNNLVEAYKNQEQWKEVEKLTIEIMEIQMKIVHAEHPDTLKSMANLALAHGGQEQWTEAGKLCTDLMVILRRRVPDAEHSDTVMHMAHLALTYESQEQSETDKAAYVTEMQQEESGCVTGIEYLDALQSLADLADIYGDHELRMESDKLLSDVMEIRKRILGAEDPKILNFMDHIAMSYINQERWDEAEKLIADMMEIQTRILGADHPKTLESKHTLAVIYQKQERWKEVENVLVSVIEEQKRVLGEEHLSTLDSITCIAMSYDNQGQWDKARKLYADVINIKTRVYGVEHPSTQESMFNVAEILHHKQQWKSAESLYYHVYCTQERLLGLEHPETWKSIVGLASVLHEQKNFEMEVRFLGNLLKAKWRVLGAEDPDTLKCKVDLARAFNEWGQPKKAKCLLDEVIKTQWRVLGKDHPDTLKTMVDVAWVCNDLGEMMVAEGLLIRIAQARQKILGAEHPDTLESMADLSRLADSYEELEQGKDAKRVIGIKQRILAEITSLSTMAT